MANDGLSGCGPRNIYVDFGASWCNTLLLHTKLEEARKRTGPWLVYAFEAAPLIAPYVESCAAELTAGRFIPAAPVPPTGSSTEFVKYVKAHGELKICFQVDERKVKECVFSLPEMVRNMSRLSAHPWLGSRETVSARLAAARHACPKRASTFTAIHAAASDADETVRMSGGIEQLMVGGSKPFGMNGLYAHNKSIGGEAHGAVWNVLAVDTVRWIQQSVRPEDFFVLKMDIEGFEHKVIPAMLKANLTGPYYGQRQKWFAYRFTGSDTDFRLDRHTVEFDAWKWAKLEDAPGLVIPFKAAVYAEIAKGFVRWTAPV